MRLSAASVGCGRGRVRCIELDLAIAVATTVNVVASGLTEPPILADRARSATPPKLAALGQFVEPDRRRPAGR
jgi:hypothetical protein